MGVFSFVGVVAAGLLWMLNAPLDRTRDNLDAHISSGLGARAIAEELQTQGLDVDPNLFVLAARLTDAANQLKAGRYEIPRDISTLELVDFLSKGKGVLSAVTLVEGFTSQQLLQKLKSQTDIVDDLATLTEKEIAQRYSLPQDSLEGWLFPDTYRYAPGSNLSELLARAIRLQREELNKAWGNRSRDLPLNSPYEALILASIIEKETGIASDRPTIASVFVNRLNRGMLLQTDPTVIYG
ncbi:MAG: endolytic transglycosylase MltG, partial [Limnobacter sp.]|nr:endolytic transglycosylase MltG [Limnobacter sp.]